VSKYVTVRLTAPQAAALAHAASEILAGEGDGYSSAEWAALDRAHRQLLSSEAEPSDAKEIDLSEAFHEWAHDVYGEDSLYEYSYECADMEHSFEAGYQTGTGESFGPPGTGTPVGIAVEIGSDDLAAFLAGVPDIQSDNIGRALVNIARYLPPGVRVRVRATYRANDETRARGRIQIPR